MEKSKVKKITRKSLVFKISTVVCCVFIFSAGLIGTIIFQQFSTIILGDIRTSLSSRIDNEANIIYGRIFSKMETKSIDYALLVANLGFKDPENLKNISSITMGSDKNIVGGGF